MKEGRKPGYPEKTPEDVLQSDCHGFISHSVRLECDRVVKP